MAAFVQALFTGSSKTAATSLAITGSKALTSGNLVAVGFGSDDVGTAFTCADNLGNTYTLQKTQVTAGSVQALLFTAPVTVAGTLTTITISWTTNVTATAASSAEFSGVGTLRLVDGRSLALGIAVGVNSIVSQFFFTGELWVGVHADEGPIIPTTMGTDGVPVQTLADAGGASTTGGAAATNIGANLGYIIIGANATIEATLGGSGNTTKPAWAGAGAIFNATARAGPPVLVRQAVNRAATF